MMHSSRSRSSCWGHADVRGIYRIVFADCSSVRLSGRPATGAGCPLRAGKAFTYLRSIDTGYRTASGLSSSLIAVAPYRRLRRTERQLRGASPLRLYGNYGSIAGGPLPVVRFRDVDQLERVERRLTGLETHVLQAGDQMSMAKESACRVESDWWRTGLSARTTSTRKAATHRACEVRAGFGFASPWRLSISACRYSGTTTRPAETSILSATPTLSRTGGS